MRAKSFAIAASYSMLTLSGTALAADAEENLEEVVVTGSRIAVPSGFTTPTPVTMVGEDLLQQRAATNVADVLNEIPSFRLSQGPEQSGRIQTNAFGGQTSPDLRGLGTVRTLSLVDGRRHVPSNTNGTLDTNLIPVILIKRVEIVTGGASATYGSDAVSGVVNFILDDKLQGVRSVIQGGISEEGDNKEVVVSLGAGTGFASERGHVIFGVDYSDNKGVGRVYERDWGRVEDGLISNGTVAQRGPNTPAQSFYKNAEFANLTTGSIVNATNLTGTSLLGTAFGPGSVPFAFPYGTRVPANTGTNMIGTTANYGATPNSNFLLRAPSERYTGMVRLNFDLTDNLTAFAEAGYGHRFSNIISSYHQTAALIIQSDNTFLPQSIRDQMNAAPAPAGGAARTITVGRLDTEWGGLPAENTTNTARGVVGLRGDLFANWKWDVYYQYGRTINESLSRRSTIESAIARSSYVVNGQCGPIATNPNLTADAVVNGVLVPGTRTLIQQIDAVRGTSCVPFNVFGAGSASPEAIAYVSGVSRGVIDLRQSVAAANISGETAELWAGPIGLAGGFEYRKDELEQTSNALAQLSAFSTLNPFPYTGESSVKEVYLEARVPLLNDLVAVKELTMDLAGRRTDYSLSGGVTTWKAGLSYSPVETLRLRATKSRDIRAPNLTELFQQQGLLTAATQFANPFTGLNQRVSAQNSGNPNLVPEIADAFTAGIVFQPTPALKASLDYYDIKVDKVISTLTTQELLTLCGQQSPGLVSPNPNSEYCQPLTFNSSNVVTRARISPENLNQQSTSGFDLEVSYQVPMEAMGLPGELNVRALGSFVRELATTTRSSAGLTTIDRAGAAINGLPKKSYNINFQYELGAVSTALGVRYTAPILYDATKLDPTDAGYNAASADSININHFPSTYYVNWNLQYKFSGALEGLEVFGVINNLLDRDPPDYAVAAFAGVGGGGNPYDFIGRGYKLGFRYKL